MLFDAKKNFHETLWTLLVKMIYNKTTIKKGEIPVLKKLTSLFLSMLICLSLLSGKAHAVDFSKPSGPSVQAESVELESTGRLKSPMIPDSAEEVPEQDPGNHKK